eukprot:6022227-Pyramimonas_sp.AAC.2
MVTAKSSCVEYWWGRTRRRPAAVSRCDQWRLRCTRSMHQSQKGRKNYTRSRHQSHKRREHIPVHEGALPVHEVHLGADAFEDLVNCGVVGHRKHRPRHLG